MDEKDQTKSPQEELDEIVEFTKKTAEQEYMRIFYLTYLNTSPLIDKFSTWLLAGCGATAALLISNIDSMIPILTLQKFRDATLMLCLCGLFGFYQKYISIKIQVFTRIGDFFSEKYLPYYAQYLKEMTRLEGLASLHKLKIDTQLNLERLHDEFMRSVPFFKRKKASKGFKKGAVDPLHGFKGAMPLYFKQVTLAMLEFFSFAGFVVFVLFAL